MLMEGSAGRPPECWSRLKRCIRAYADAGSRPNGLYQRDDCVRGDDTLERKTACLKQASKFRSGAFARVAKHCHHLGIYEVVHGRAKRGIVVQQLIANEQCCRRWHRRMALREDTQTVII